MGVNGHPRGTPRQEPHGTLRNGKLGELRVESVILRVPGPAFCFLPPSPIYGGFVYLSFPRWVLGVNGHPRGTPHGTVKLGNCEWRPEFLWIPVSIFCFSFPVTIYGGFVYFAFPRWVLMATPAERPRNPTGPHGAPRIGKIGELRIESGI